jgi:hypothetical protein
MQIHGRAKLGPAGRLALCEAVEGGMALRQAAGCFGVSVATAHRWWHRRLDASFDELAQGSGCSIVPVALGAALDCLTRSSRSASVRRGDTPGGDQGSWPAGPDTLTRRCGRCCIAMVSLG